MNAYQRRQRARRIKFAYKKLSAALEKAATAFGRFADASGPFIASMSRLTLDRRAKG